MPESLDESELSLPCPTCDYDLRAQIEPRCPECGRAFASIEELRRIATDVKQVLDRVLLWRFKFAIAYMAAIAWVPIALTYVDLYFQQPGPALTLGILVALIPVLSMPLLAIYFLVRVLRLRFDIRIAKEQRRALNRTILILVLYTLPALAFLPPAIMVIIKKAWLGVGV